MNYFPGLMFSSQKRQAVSASDMSAIYCTTGINQVF